MDKIAVVIPCYRVVQQIEDVVSSIDDGVSWIICVDDKCPESSGRHIEDKFRNDPRVEVLYHEHNKGVGAAVVTGYRKALERGADVIVKLDGDGQMDAEQIPRLIVPIIRGEADYTKGNRFYSPENIAPMPVIRIVGNAGLSFFAKLSTGYWEIFDPSNGFTAIQAKVARTLPLEKVSHRYFFETDMLFRLNTLRAVVTDIPMKSVYGNERSNLNVWYSLVTFPFLHAANFVKRIVYNYFVRDFNIATINLVLGIAMLVFGFVFGVTSWLQAITDERLASPGTVMLAGLPIIIGTQLTLNFLSYDMSSQPRDPVHKRL